MAVMNTCYSYGSVSKFLHWLIALLVIIMLILGFYMPGITNEVVRGDIYTIHKSLGLTILVLMILRLIWRIINPTPLLPPTVPRWQKIAARANHILFYAFLILMPITGWIMSTAAGKSPTYFFWFVVRAPGITKNAAIAKFFHQTHTILAWVIIVLIVIHIAAALKHHFLDKDDVLKRMLPGRMSMPSA